MLKKVIKLAVVMSLIVTSMNAFAQNNGKPEYPRYGFWSNWSIGASIDLNDQAVMGGFNFGDKWRVSTNTGMSIFAQQKLNHAFDWRIRFGFPSFGAPRKGIVAGNEKDSAMMDRHATLTLDMLFSLNNAIMGYDPDRRFNLYIFGGGGLGFSFNAEESANNFGTVGITLDGGLGASYRFGSPNCILLNNKRLSISR